MTEQTTKRHWHAFLFALCIATVVFLPFVIHDGGYFIYYGDFNVQQIPFYKLAHEAVRSGDIYWNWYTDLGANFFGSYTFYLLFSPFFWLTLPFPTTWVPFLMAPLLVLKTACAAFTSYFYLARFVRDTRWAMLGSLMYAFSGWMSFNIFFNHFHDVAVFFPLLLLGVEQLVCEDKKVFFAVAVMVNAMVNYWFFIGEVVFVVLYVIIRTASRAWPMNIYKFLRLGFEAILGVGCAAVVLLPSVMALMGNPRTGVDELLYGWNFWLYWHEQRQPAILQSLFFPPELPAWPNFLPDHGAKWSSLSAWIPLLGMSCVLAYFFQTSRQKDWLKRSLVICFIIAMVPGLNSIFILLNHSYYARWFYMPILLMSLATVRALEEGMEDSEPFRRSLKWCTGIILVFIIMSGITPNKVDDEWKIGLAQYTTRFWIYAAFTIAFLIITAVLLLKLRRRANFRRYLAGAMVLTIVSFNIYYMSNGKNNDERSQFIINNAIEGRYKLSLPDDGFARSDAYDSIDNLLMFWHIPNIQAFHSIVPISIMEFYPSVGVKRDVGSRPEAEFYALRPLLSVRWLFIRQDNEQQEPMPGYVKYSEQLDFNVYENTNYIPMGFTYDYYINQEQFEAIAVKRRGNLLLRAILLEEDAIQRNADILQNLDTTKEILLNDTAMEQDAAMRRRYTADTFEYDKTGFTATTSFERDQLIFFSVPHEGGWSATVNGQPAQIEKVNVGFMGVRVPAGQCNIRFDYMTPGLYSGMVVTLGFVVILVIYSLIRRKKQVALVREVDLQRSLFSGETVQLSWDEFLAQYNKEDRQAKLQQALDEAVAARMEDEGVEDDEFPLAHSFSPEQAEDEEDKAEATDL